MMSFLLVNKHTKNVCLLQWYWELPHFLGIQNDFDSFNMGTHWNSNFALSSQWLGLGTAYFIAFSPFHWNLYGQGHASQNAEFFSSLSLCRPSRPSFFVGCKLSLQRSLRLDFYCMGPKCNVIFQIPLSKECSPSLFSAADPRAGGPWLGCGHCSNLICSNVPTE